MQVSQGQSGAANYIIAVLRKVTRGAQLVPFAYLLLLAFVLLFEPLLSDAAFNAINELLYMPPAVFGIGFLLSRTLKLCVWHKISCAIPLIPQVENYIDGYIIEFTQNEVILINVALGILTLAFIIQAIKHFFYGRKANTDGNP